MKAKKLLLPLLLICIAFFLMSGCTPKTEYDDKEVLKLQTAFHGGFTIVDADYTRTFDFETCTISDEVVVQNKEEVIDFLLEFYDSDNSGYDSIESYEAFLQSQFNTPKPFISFSEEQAEKLLNTIKSRGIYTWEESYISQMVDDASWHSITITFKDGTVKTTEFYCEYPDNFYKIVSAFNHLLGVGLWWGSMIMSE